MRFETARGKRLDSGCGNSGVPDIFPEDVWTALPSLGCQVAAGKQHQPIHGVLASYQTLKKAEGTRIHTRTHPPLLRLNLTRYRPDRVCPNARMLGIHSRPDWWVSISNAQNAGSLLE